MISRVNGTVRQGFLGTPPAWARWISPLVLLGLWQLASSTGVLPDTTIGSPEDIAHAVCFLASEGASYITGHVLAVNGGMYS